MKVLVLGDGKLGSELVKQTGWDYVSRKHNLFNINNVNEYSHHRLDKYDVIVNCIANTNTYSNIKEDMYNVNFLYPKNLSDFCKQNSVKLVHISTDYIYSNSQSIATEESLPLPLPNWYTYSKLLADEYISSTNANYLICRCSFKSKPFEFNNAWLNQFGNFDYVDVIAELIIKLIKKNALGIFNVGTELKTMYELAKQTNPNVIPILRPNYVPADVTLNLTKLNNFLNK